MNRSLPASTLAARMLVTSLVTIPTLSPALAADKPADKPATQTAAPAASTDPVPAGAYTLDKAHASLVFRLSHLGFSHYTARFTKYDAQLQFDPAHPEASRVTVTIDPKSIDADGAPEGFMATLAGPQWLDAAKYPAITYRSTRVEKVGSHGLRISGELELHGVRKPVTLNAAYNGGYASHPFEPRARIGFSAQGTLKRSEFGMGFGTPAPGSTFGVGDDLEIVIECEFSGPETNKP